MPGRNLLLRYLAVFLAVGIAASITYRAGLILHGMMACRPSPEPGAFLAVCQSAMFGDYEHGAFWLGLEPEALDHLRRADVLMLGNSRAQFAFSTDAVKHYFTDRSIPYYILGFGHGQFGRFAQLLLEKEKLSPKALVIVADPFFRDALTEPAQSLAGQNAPFWARLAARQDYFLKKLVVEFQSRLCRSFPGACSGRSRTIYRSATSGAWIWRNVFAAPEAASIPVPPRRGPSGRGPEPADRVFAVEFLRTAGVSNDCVVLTVTPNARIDAEGYAREMGRYLGVLTIFPKVDGLATIDGSHLTWSSAQRWSDAFLREIDSMLTRCAGGGAAPAARVSR